LGSPGASSGHPGLTPSGLEALTTHAAGRDYDQGKHRIPSVMHAGQNGRPSVCEHLEALAEGLTGKFSTLDFTARPALL